MKQEADLTSVRRTSVQEQPCTDVTVSETESLSVASLEYTDSQSQDTGSQGQDTGIQGQDTGSKAQDSVITEPQRTTRQDTTESCDDRGVPMEMEPGEEDTTPSVTAGSEPASKQTATTEEQTRPPLEPSGGDSASVGESEVRTREAESSAAGTGEGVPGAAGVGVGMEEKEAVCSGEGSEGTVQRPSVSILGK